MAERISRQTAQEIVETIKDLCACDTNFIDTDGHIYASTDPERLDTYHEIGHKAAQTGQIIEADRDDSYLGTRKGVNIPITFHGDVCAVIGISGEPEEIRRYAQLARRITRILLREQEMEQEASNKRREMSYVVSRLVTGEPLQKAYLEEVLQETGIDRESHYRTAIMRTGAGFHPSNIRFLERDVMAAMEKMQALYCYRYPNEYCLVFPESKLEPVAKGLTELTHRYAMLLRAGIGAAAPLEQQKRSFDTAVLALESAKDRTCVSFDELDLEILLGSIGEDVGRRYKEKTISTLTEEDRELLRVYYEHDMSLKQTGESLFLHKNTLQYRLNRIKEQTGYDPRVFSQGVILYLALKV